MDKRIALLLIGLLSVWAVAGEVASQPPDADAKNGSQAGIAPSERRADRLLGRILEAPLKGGFDHSMIASSIPKRIEDGERRVAFWHFRQAGSDGQRFREAADKDEDVRVFRALGPAAAAACNRALAEIKPGDPKAAKLAMLTGLVGDRRSMGLLVDLLANAGRSYETRATYTAAMWGLWELSGRRLQRTSAFWKRWWPAVAGSFAPARDRGRRPVAAGQVRPLIEKLTGADDEFVREQLVMLGPNALPHLLKALGGAAGEAKFCLAWVIDELDAARSIPGDVRRAYFTWRLAGGRKGNWLHEAACERALRDQELADFCQVLFEVARRRAAAGQPKGPGRWLRLSRGGLKALMSRGQPERAAAVAAVVAALEDPDESVRWVAMWLAEQIGRAGAAAPPELAGKLCDRWLAERDGELRRAAVSALVKFRAAAVDKAVRAGLWSDRTEIVADSAAMCRQLWRRDAKPPSTRPADTDEQPKPAVLSDKAIVDRLAALAVDSDARIRRESVAALQERAPERLEPLLARLSKDSDEEVRRRCAMVMKQLKDPAHMKLLLEMIFDPQRRASSQVFYALADPVFAKAVPALTPLLRDERYANLATWAIAGAAGPDAAAVLVQEICEANAMLGQTSMALRKLTGREFRTPKQVLQWWWQFPLAERVTPRADLDERQLEELWAKLAGKVGLEAHKATLTMAAAGQRAAAFLAERVKPVSADTQRIKTLIGQLDSPKYGVRREALAELSRIGRPAEAALRAALKGKSSVEARQRISKLLEACSRPYPVLPEARRVARAVRVLELIGTPQAVDLVRKLAKGTPKAHTTEQAKAALQRLGKRRQSRLSK